MDPKVPKERGRNKQKKQLFRRIITKHRTGRGGSSLDEEDLNIGFGKENFDKAKMQFDDAEDCEEEKAQFIADLNDI